MEPLVLICNPMRSKLEKDLIDLLRQDTTLNYLCIYNINSDRVSKIHPNIVFFILCDGYSSIEPAEVEKLQKHFPLTPIIGILSNVDMCVEYETFRKTIWNFLSYPLRKEDIFLTIKWFCYESSGIEKTICSSLKKQALTDLFKGESKESLKIKEKILNIAQYDVAVLIEGETGTGKELCAKMIHFLSNRSKNPFIPVNCGAIPAELFENELFGHKKGAYTNAESTQTGLIAEAEKGILFLDEIESLPQLMQVKLLRFLEEKKYKPLGQSNYINADVRIIAATKENLRNKIKCNQFREDLFYRLNVLNITLPPLRERQQDIPVLAYHFINRYSKLYNKKIEGIRPIAVMEMLHYNWEGNIRELENLLQEAIIMNTTGWIEKENMTFYENSNQKINPIISFKSAKQNMITDFEKTYLDNILLTFRGNLTRAAKFAKKDRRAFIRLLKKHNINPAFYRN